MAKSKRKTGLFVFDFTKYNQLIKRGLCNGASDDAGSVCIEAAVTIALGETKDPLDNDGTDPKYNPSCVSRALSTLKVEINDANGWKSSAARTKALKLIGVAQLGTKDKKAFNYKEFYKVLTNLFRQKGLYTYFVEQGYVECSKELEQFFSSGRYKNPNFFEESFLSYLRDNVIPVSTFTDPVEAAVGEGTEQTLITICECVLEALKQVKAPGIKFLKRVK